MRASPTLARVGLVALAFLLVGCASPAGIDPSSSGDGPGGSGLVTAEPIQGVGAVDFDSACDLAAASETLASWNAALTPVDASQVFALSFCELTVEIPGVSEPSMGVQIITAADVALTASTDPDILPGSFVLLPDLGENGHFTSQKPDVGPESDPTTGALTAAKGELGVILSWATGADVVAYAEYERVVTELLAALP